MRKIVRKVPATTNNLTKAIIQHLLSKGHYAFRVNNGSVFDPKRNTFRKKSAKDPALSDIMGVLSPSSCFIAIEVKNAETGDKPKSKQKLFADEIKARGGYHYFAKRFSEYLEWYEEHIYDEQMRAKDGNA